MSFYRSLALPSLFPFFTIIIGSILIAAPAQSAELCSAEVPDFEIVFPTVALAPEGLNPPPLPDPFRSADPLIPSIPPSGEFLDRLHDQDLLILISRAIQSNQIELATQTAWKISDRVLKIQALTSILGQTRSSSLTPTQLQAAEALETEIYQYLNKLPAYRAVLQSQVAAQYAQQQQAQKARLFFEQAIATIQSVQPVEQQELATQAVILNLLAAGELDRAILMATPFKNQISLQLEMAIALAEQGRYQESLAIAIPITERTRYPELKRLVQRFLRAGQLNCSLQLALTPEVDSAILDDIDPELLLPLIQVGRGDAVLNILKAWAQFNPEKTQEVVKPLMKDLVTAGQADAAWKFATALENPRDRLVVLAELAQVLARSGQVPFATRILAQAEKIAAEILATPDSTANIPEFLPITPAVTSVPDQSLIVDEGVDNAQATAQTRRHHRAMNLLTLAPLYSIVLDQNPKAIAMFNEALDITLPITVQGTWWKTEQAMLVKMILEQYSRLDDTTPMRSHLDELRKKAIVLPNGNEKTRQLRSIAYGFAIFGAAEEALQTLPFKDMPSLTQQHIVFTRARTLQFYEAIRLAKQIKEPYELESPEIDSPNPIETWAQLSADTAMVGQLELSEQAFTQVLSRIRFIEVRDEYWLPHFEQFYADRRLYPFAQRLILEHYSSNPNVNSFSPTDYISPATPHFGDLTLPLPAQSKRLFKVATIAIQNHEAALTPDLIRAIPSPIDRARSMAQLAIALHQNKQFDLAKQILQEAEAIAKTLPNHIGKAYVLLAIHQAYAQVEPGGTTGDRLTQVVNTLN